MKKIMAAALLLTATSAVALADPPRSCAERISALENELQYAKQYGNNYKVRGIERGLQNVKEHCNADTEVRDAQKYLEKRQEKVNKRGYELKKAQAELEEAKAKGKSSKIIDKEKKVREKQFKLEEAQRALEEAKKQELLK